MQQRGNSFENHNIYLSNARFLSFHSYLLVFITFFHCQYIFKRKDNKIVKKYTFIM